MTEEQRTIDDVGALTEIATRMGQRLYIKGRWIKSLSFPLVNPGAWTGAVTFTVRKVSDNSVIVSKLWGDAGDISDEIAWYEVIFDDLTWIDEEVRVLTEYAAPSGDDYIKQGYSDTAKGTEKRTAWSSFGEAWTDQADKAAAYSYDYEPCVSVAASADDCSKDEDSGGFWLTTHFGAGYASATYPSMGSAARIFNLPIPKGVTITAAQLRLTAFESRATAGVKTRIRCQAAVNPKTFSTVVDFDARSWTTAYVNWDDIAAWTQDEVYVSPDFKAALQAVIDQPDWQTGNAVVVLWDDFEERSDAVNLTTRVAYSFDTDPDKSPQLYVAFEFEEELTPSYKYSIDWEDFDLNSLYGNITGDVKPGATWEMGKEAELGRASAGTAEIVLTNHDFKYSPNYGASPLFGYVRPGKILTITAFFEGIEYPQYCGRLNKIVPHPALDQQDIYIYCVDDMDILATTRISLALYEDTKSGALITAILDAVGWDADKRQIAVGTVAPNYFTCHEEFALEKIHELEDIEGGFFYVDCRGYAVWEGRYYRATAPRIFPKYTITHTTGIDYEYSLEHIRNKARGTYILQGTLTGPFPPTLDPEDEPDGYYRLPLRAKLISVDPLVYETDYEWNVEHFFVEGSYRFGYWWGNWPKYWVEADAVVSLAGRILTVHVNSFPTGLWWVTFYFEGYPLRETGKLVVEESDATSISEYGQRDYYIDSPLSTDETKLKSLLGRIIARNKDVRVTDMPIDLVNHSDEMWKQILERHISDKIILQCVPLGIDDNYFINKVIHRVSSGNVHEARWVLERVAPEYYWTLGLSELGIGTRLGY